MGFVKFMSSPAGRIARIVAGLALIVIGIVIGGAGWVLAIVGLLPLAAGALNICVFAPLFKQPLKGSEVRAKLGG